MTPTVLLGALCGAGAGVGVLLILRGLLGPGAVEDRPDAPRWWSRVSRWRAGRRRSDGRRVALCVAVGLIVAVVTRWPVAAMLSAAAVWVLPGLIGPDRDHKRRLARIEAVATWTESLRDTLSAAAGLEQAIIATAPLAPEAIRDEVTRLAGRLGRNDRLSDALRDFAADIDDATGDLVVTALVMAAERDARHIGELLSSLATAAREQASLRMRVVAGRARVRTSSRVITTVTLIMAGGLVLLNRGYLQPYDTVTGQLVILIVGGFFAFGLAWLARINRIEEPDRVLAPREPVGVGP
jgi:tight adherence protein B